MHIFKSINAKSKRELSNITTHDNHFFSLIVTRMARGKIFIKIYYFYQNMTSFDKTTRQVK